MDEMDGWMGLVIGSLRAPSHQGKKITNGTKTNGILRESLQTFPDKIKWKTQGPTLTGLGATNLTRKEV